jgi:hypothetical protein
MSVDSVQSSSQNPFIVGRSNIANAAGLKGKNEPQKTNETSETENSVKISSADVERIRQIAKRLVAQDDIRPEVVAGRSASEPLKPISNKQVSEFVKALKNEP